MDPTEVQLLQEPPRWDKALAGHLPPGWTWEDPLGDCSLTIHQGLEIHAANGRDLWRINLSAPRALHSAFGDLVVQATCVPVSDDRPTVGGILLWQDKENYLHLARGVFGEQDVSLRGCLDNRDVIVGRGQLPAHERAGGRTDTPADRAKRVFLRLERIGERVQAFCSADGKRWLTVGHATFPDAGPVRVGVHAIGSIHRTIYHGAYPDGTAIRFESFWLQEM
jgi:hypothetical protein